ncbi:acetyl-CoA C-acetyltransferase [Acholeplasma granularum]|uniref:acetyl-CoA C-acetyltransferase n=1 Tax=Acholeplasma granularum TaxID=264635 RepID=UPI00046FB540|nr:acetyl-CoA C-acetyltransferase [Acholeplasma granularum]
MSKVYVVAAKRSAIGSYLGTLAQISPADFGSQVLKQTLEVNNIKSEWIDEVIIGNVLPAGQKQGLPRQISIKAGIAPDVPAYGVNMICGSGMKSVITGFASIKAGLANMVVAGGVESMSQAPYLVPGTVRNGVKMGDLSLIDYMVTEGLTDAFEGYHMGITAENIVDKHGFTREMQDDFAYHSQVKAKAAQEAGLFVEEIIPVTIKTRKADIVFDKDEYINYTTTREKIAALRPAFKKDGTVTAASSSGINDGASFMVLASEEMVKKHNLKPLVEIIGVGQAGVEPSVMGLGPVQAIINSLKIANLKITDIDTFELNEAFAAQALGVVRELSQELNIKESMILDKTNPNGGAIALGHPVGASGNRIMVTLIHNLLRNKDHKVGLASLCIGGGMGTSVILKKI